MANSKVFLVGAGTCRIDSNHGQTSACVIDGDTTFIIDCGFGSLERLDRLRAFDRCTTLHIHISHRHTDHLIGIFPLLQCLTYADDARYLSVKRVVIHATEEVCTLIKAIRATWGEHETSLVSSMRGTAERVIEYRPGPDFNDWSYSVGGISVRSVHLPDSNNHGVSFSVDNTRYAFTGDATGVNDTLVQFCKESDVCVFDFGHMTNMRQADGSFVINLSQATTLLSQANSKKMFACHVYLRHLQEQILSVEERSQEVARLISSTAELARKAGFSGELLLGQDGTQL